MKQWMSAMMFSKGQYISLKQAKEMLELLEIAKKIDKRLKGHDRSKNIPWEKIKKKHGL